VSSAQTVKVTLASATVTASGQGSAIDLGADASEVARSYAFEVLASSSVEVETGLSVTIETSADGVSWATLAQDEDDEPLSFSTPQTAKEKRKLLPPNCLRYVRAVWIVTDGSADPPSPSWTLKVRAWGAFSYCAPVVLTSTGLPIEALEVVKTFALADALRVATGVVYGYLARFYEMPLIAWTPSVERAVTIIAAYDILTARGYNPTAEANEEFSKRYASIIKWLEYVGANGEEGVIGSPEDEEEEDDDQGGGMATVVSRERRGWE
jgi:phage gp36-like protein